MGCRSRGRYHSQRGQGQTKSQDRDTGEPCAVKIARTVCAVRRFEIFLSQTGGTREVFLSYQLTLRRKPRGTTACVGKRCMLEGVVEHGIRMARPLWVRLDCLNCAPHHQESDPPRRGERYGRKTSGSSNSPDGESLKGQEPVGNTRNAPKTLRAWTCKTRVSW